MNRINSLMLQYKFDPAATKKDVANAAFVAGFLASRKLCAVMARIAQLENKDAQAEVLKVGSEEVKSSLSLVPDDLSDIILDTLA